MRALILSFGVLALSACAAVEREEITDCEQYIQSKLRSPSTYKRIRADTTFMENEKPPQTWVSIEYDAANAYGTPIRETQICKYPQKGGRPDTSQFIDHDAELMNDVTAIDNLAFDTGAAAAPPVMAKPSDPVASGAAEETGAEESAAEVSEQEASFGEQSSDDLPDPSISEPPANVTAQSERPEEGGTPD